MRFDPVSEGIIGAAQLLSYLKLTGCSIGLLINFNVALLKNGLRRLVRGFEEVDPSRASRSSR